MAARGFYHDGMLALQEAANGRRVAEFLAIEARQSEFSESDVAQIEKASFFFIASSYGDQPDCSFKGRSRLGILCDRQGRGRVFPDDQ